jgi:hypothetical protein
MGRKILWVFVSLLFGLSGHTFAAQSVDILPFAAGTKLNIGGGFPDAYFTGRSGDASVNRGFLSFTLPTGTASVSSAQLRSVRGIVDTPDPFETVEVYDVTTPAAELPANAPNVGIFDDLGSGALYGASSDFFPGADQFGVIAIDLNAAAIDAINANLGGNFSVGFALATIDPRPGLNEFIFLGILPHLPVLRLTLVPEPGSLLVALICGGGLAMRRKQCMPR